MTRTKIILGGFETWVEYNVKLCCITLFGSDIAKHGVGFDVMGLDGHKYINNFFCSRMNFGSMEHLKLTDQEKKELNNYINNLHISN
jgi:hypothetical protein